MVKCSLCRSWQSFTRWLHAWLRKGFYALGRICAEKPWVVIGCVLFVVAISSLGLLNVKEETRVERLWVPQGSAALSDQQYITDHFGKDPRAAISIISSQLTQATVLTQQILQNALSLHLRLMNIVVGDGKTFSHLCYRAFDGGDCVIDSVLSLWSYNASILSNDSDVVSTIANAPPVSCTGLPFEPRTSLGLVSYNSTGGIVAAKALRLSYFLSSYPSLSSHVLQWEEQFLSVTGGHQLAGLRVTRFAERSFDDELERSISGDIPLVAGTFAIMVAYTCWTLGRRDCTQSKTLLGAAGILSVVLALLTAFGICAGLGVMFSSLNMILPFLLLGIGIDDMFILVHCFETICRCTPASETTRMAIAVSKASIPITMTSLTSFLAFMLSSTSSLPAISAFSIYAAVSVLFDYVFQITFFVACVSIDRRRAQQRRNDCLFCIKSRPTQWSQSNAAGQGFFRRVFGPCMMRSCVQIPVILLFAGFTSFGIYAATGLQQGIKIPNDIVPDDSYLISYFEAARTYFAHLGDPLVIVMRTFDYGAAGNQQGVDDLTSAVMLSEDIIPPLVSWYANYLVWINATAPFNSSLRADGTPPSSTEFYSWLLLFLNSTVGARFRPDVAFLPNGSISASRLSTNIRRFDDTIAEKDAMLAMRDLTAAALIPAFAYSQAYLFLEQYIVIARDTMVTILTALGSMLMLTLFFLVYLPASFMTVLAVSMINMQLFGVMFLWNVNLNSVSLAVLIMGIGLSVDYCAHVVHSFMDHRGSRQERSIKAITTMSRSVLRGATSTFLGIVLLIFSTSSVFRVFFKLLFSLIVLSVLHGMVFLPIMLSHFGPTSLQEDWIPPCHLARIEQMPAVADDDNMRDDIPARLTIW